MIARRVEIGWLAVLGAVAIAYTATAFIQNWPAQASDPLGAGFFPKVIGVTLIVSVLLELWRTLAKRTPVTEGPGTLDSLTRPDLVDALFTLGAMVVLVIGFVTIGPIPSIALFVAALLRRLGRVRYWLSALIGLVAGLAMFTLFDRVFGVALPYGFVESAFVDALAGLGWR